MEVNTQEQKEGGGTKWEQIEKKNRVKKKKDPKHRKDKYPFLVLYTTCYKGSAKP